MSLPVLQVAYAFTAVTPASTAQHRERPTLVVTCIELWAAQVTTISEGWEPRKTKRPQLVRNFCRSCGADVCHDSFDDDGKLIGRVRCVV